METLSKIPSPPSLKWREFRYNFMPAAVFALVRRPVFAMYVGLGLGGAITSGLIFQAVFG